MFKLNLAFSVSRWWSIVLKEFLQLKRDRVTFAMIVGLPIIQLTLFGYAITPIRSTCPRRSWWAKTARFHAASWPA